MELAIQFLEEYLDKWRRWGEMADGVGMPTEPFTRKIEIAQPIIRHMKEGKSPTPKMKQFIEEVVKEHLENMNLGKQDELGQDLVKILDFLKTS